MCKSYDDISKVIAFRICSVKTTSSGTRPLSQVATRMQLAHFSNSSFSQDFIFATYFVIKAQSTRPLSVNHCNTSDVCYSVDFDWYFCLCLLCLKIFYVLWKIPFETANSSDLAKCGYIEGEGPPFPPDKTDISLEAPKISEAIACDSCDIFSGMVLEGTNRPLWSDMNTI